MAWDLCCLKAKLANTGHRLHPDFTLVLVNTAIWKHPIRKLGTCTKERSSISSVAYKTTDGSTAIFLTVCTVCLPSLLCIRGRQTYFCCMWSVILIFCLQSTQDILRQGGGLIPEMGCVSKWRTETKDRELDRSDKAVQSIADQILMHLDWKERVWPAKTKRGWAVKNISQERTWYWQFYKHTGVNEHEASWHTW